MEEKIKIISSELGDLRVKKNVDLNEYVLLKDGGQASAFFIATSSSELRKAVLLCRELNLAFFLIGSGSKITIPKIGFQGLVIKNRSNNQKIFGVKGKVSRIGIGIKEAFIEADSGVTLPDLAAFSSKQGLIGFEGLSKSIGTVGGSILSNSQLRDKTVYISVLDNSGEIVTKNLERLLGNDVILKVIFLLKAKEV